LKSGPSRQKENIDVPFQLPIGHKVAASVSKEFVKARFILQMAIMPFMKTKTIPILALVNKNVNKSIDSNRAHI